MTKESTIEKLRYAWQNLPPNAKGIVFEKSGYTAQGVNHILTHGRKDESIMEKLLECIKEASAEACRDAVDKNRQVQEI